MSYNLKKLIKSLNKSEIRYIKVNANKYNLEISFNQTVVKTSLTSGDYHSAIKKMMMNLQGKFAEILETVNKREAKAKSNEKAKSDESESEKIYH